MATPPSRIMYVELKRDDGRGPAWIGRVKFSKSGRTLTYRGRSYQSSKGSGVSGNYFDIESGEEAWISGPKRNGQDRHWAGGGPVEIDADIAEEYWQEIRQTPAPTNPLPA